MTRLWTSDAESQNATTEGVSFVSGGAGATVGFDTTQPHLGSVAYKAQVASSTFNAYLHHDFTAAAGRHYYMRQYLYVGSLPTAQINVGGWLTPTAIVLQLDTSGNLFVWNGPASASGGTVGTLVAGQYYLLEGHLFIPASGNGALEWKLNGTLTANSSTNVNVGLSEPTGVAFGVSYTGGVSLSATLYVDDLALNDDQGTSDNSWIGPTNAASFGGSGGIAPFTASLRTIAFRAKTDVNSASTSVSSTLPTGTVAGDAMLLFVYAETSTAGIQTPTGWTLVTGSSQTTTKFCSAVFFKAAGASEGAVTVSTSSGTFIEVCRVSYSTAGSPAVDTQSNASGGSATSTSLACPSLTTSFANEMVVWGGFNFTATTTVPTGFTNRQNAADVAVGDELFASAGATGTMTGTDSVADWWTTTAVALKDSSMGGGGTVSSGTVNVGGGPDGLALILATDIATLGGAGGLAAVLSLALSGVVDVGGAGALDDGIQLGGDSGLGFGCLLGGGPGGLGATSRALGGASLGGGPEGLSVASAALGTCRLGGSGGLPGIGSQALTGPILEGGAGGLQASGIALLPILATLGALGGGLSVNGGIFIVVHRVHMGTPDVPGGGLRIGQTVVSYPGGHWAFLTCWIWRETSPGAGTYTWKPCPIAVWRGPGTGWKQLTT